MITDVRARIQQEKGSLYWKFGCEHEEEINKMLLVYHRMEKIKKENELKRIEEEERTILKGITRQKANKIDPV